MLSSQTRRPFRAQVLEKHPELRPEWARGNSKNGNEAPASECVAAPVGRDVFVVSARVKGWLGLDLMAAVNLIRADAVPPGVVITEGGLTLHGVGQAAKGTVQAEVTLGGLRFADVEFVVVDNLPVSGLLGKPSLTAMCARLDLVKNTAELSLGVHKAMVHAMRYKLSCLRASSRPEAQSYWVWLNKRLADVPKRLQPFVSASLAFFDKKRIGQNFPSRPSGHHSRPPKRGLRINAQVEGPVPIRHRQHCLLRNLPPKLDKHLLVLARKRVRLPGVVHNSLQQRGLLRIVWYKEAVASEHAHLRLELGGRLLGGLVLPHSWRESAQSASSAPSPWVQLPSSESSNMNASSGKTFGTAASWPNAMPPGEFRPPWIMTRNSSTLLRALQNGTRLSAS
jgi:hypothetical protein